ncbi:hypothetical protein ACA910_021096 [Epithemia clementina (nom. ined.)]
MEQFKLSSAKAQDRLLPSGCLFLEGVCFPLIWLKVLMTSGTCPCGGGAPDMSGFPSNLGAPGWRFGSSSSSSKFRSSPPNGADICFWYILNELPSSEGSSCLGSNEPKSDGDPSATVDESGTSLIIALFCFELSSHLPMVPVEHVNGAVLRGVIAVNAL